MRTPFNNHLSSSDGNDKNFKAEKRRFFEYLYTHTATASMVFKATGILEKNICWYKKHLEKSGTLKRVEQKPFGNTGRKAWYLSTNPHMFPFDPQTKLFQAKGSHDGN
jgi:hypothetical protein